MIRRNFMKMLGLGGSTTLLAGSNKGELEKEFIDLHVGPMNLSNFEIIDAHLHQPKPATLSESYKTWNSDFVDAIIPSYDFDGKAKLQAKMSKVFESHLYNLPRQIGYTNYVARVYGVNPTIEDFDKVVSEHLGNFPAYIESILDREKIPVLVLQSDNPEPVIPSTYIPSSRFVWTYPFVDLIQPDWAKRKGIKNIPDMLEECDQVIKSLVSNGCKGIKNEFSYYRNIGLEKVEKSQAEEAMKILLQSKPTGYNDDVLPAIVPQYQDRKLIEALRLYNDYLIKYMYVKAGEVGLPVIIHVAVALHPNLRFEWNNPLDLFNVFKDDEIQRAETQFILTHGGYPYHHIVASMISQFPNVFTDVSFYSKFPGVLEETLRAFLSLAPSEKVMHGSDSNRVPEEIGYCASNTRRVLARILNDFRTYYGWTDKDCEKIARNVMSDNARRIFKIKM